MSFRLVPKSVTLNDLERRNGFALRYFTDFGKVAFQHITASISGGIYMHESIVFCSACIYDVVKSSRSLSHLLVSFFVCNSVRYVSTTSTR